MSAPETVTSSDGTPIAFWRSGDGPPLVLVHGTAADHSRWAPVLPALEERFAVIAVDRRGRGGSGDAEDYAIEREFEDLAAVADRAGAGATLLGHSYGAVCALGAAPLTGNVGRLVLYEPPVGMAAPPPEVIDRLLALLEAGERDELLALFMAEVAGVAPEHLELMRSRPSWEARLAVAHTIPRELRADLERGFALESVQGLGIPTLLLQGGESRTPFKTAVELLDATLPDSRVVVMPGQGHVAMDTATELFTDVVIRFLAATT